MLDFIKFDQLQGAAVGRKWTKRVQNEWKILQNNIPGTIQYKHFFLRGQYSTNMIEKNFYHDFLE